VIKNDVLSSHPARLARDALPVYHRGMREPISSSTSDADTILSRCLPPVEEMKTAGRGNK
jgi:hypothetical protein